MQSIIFVAANMTTPIKHALIRATEKKCSKTPQSKAINNAILLLMEGPPQILAAMFLSQHLDSSSRTSNQWYPLGALCNGHSRIKQDAVWSNAPHLQIDVLEQVPICAWMTRIFQHQCKGGWVVLKQVWADPFQVALGLGTKRRSYDWFSEYFTAQLQSIRSAGWMLSLDNKSSSSLRATGKKGCRDRILSSWAVMGPTINWWSGCLGIIRLRYARKRVALCRQSSAAWLDTC